MSNRNFETVMVFSVASGEEAKTTLVEKFRALIEANGVLDSVDEWGQRRLAYPINDETEGWYALYNYECGPDFPSELDRQAKITDGVLRSLIIKKD
ncbi:MAG: 30S ribosomal protein S6 [Oscillospiraceae bacterium]|nr:30S ribosomal protein S6 [Oscillospiraceae bacterium]